MGIMQTIELNLSMLVSIIAVVLSAYSITQAKKRSDSAEIKEATKQITELTVKMDGLMNQLMGKPTISEIIAQHAIMLENHDKRIDKIEKDHNNE